MSEIGTVYLKAHTNIQLCPVFYCMEGQQWFSQHRTPIGIPHIEEECLGIRQQTKPIEQPWLRQKRKGDDRVKLAKIIWKQEISLKIFGMNSITNYCKMYYEYLFTFMKNIEFEIYNTYLCCERWSTNVHAYAYLYIQYKAFNVCT